MANNRVASGLDVLITESFKSLRGRNIMLVCNQASIAADCKHAIDYFFAEHEAGKLTLKSLVGPQHGLWGHTQDNMIEWEGGGESEGIPIHSLYGRYRKPTPEMLEGVDTIVVDLQDVGAKYYTFIWTLAHCMEAAHGKDIEVVVPDRPNPIGGQVEGPALNEDFRSFVGLYPLTIRHGLTIGEVALYLKNEIFQDSNLRIVKMQGYKPEMYFEETGLPWAMPSPNIPTVESAVVYPGKCLIEATNLSEGRGTTRPFELFGAPWFNTKDLLQALGAHNLPGLALRPLQFQPTFHKFAGEICEGFFLHVTDRTTFKPFLTTIALFREVRRLYPDKFRWNDPPYEYEYEKMPMDILSGNDWLRQAIDAGEDLLAMEERWQKEAATFDPIRQAARLYT
ncbi:MAG: DUF1343 domain-containing protein [Calditrichota bacterium]